MWHDESFCDVVVSSDPILSSLGMSLAMMWRVALFCDVVVSSNPILSSLGSLGFGKKFCLHVYVAVVVYISICVLIYTDR